MDFKKIKEQIRWIRKQYSDMLDQKNQEKKNASKAEQQNADANGKNK